MANQERTFNKKVIISVVLGIISLIVTKVSFLGMAIGAIGLGIVLVGTIEIIREKQKGIIFAFLAIILNAIGTLLPALVYVYEYIKWMYPNLL